MKKTFLRILLSVAILICGGVFLPEVSSYAEGEPDESSDTAEAPTGGTSIRLTPVSNVLQISSNSVYEDSLTVTNDGDSPIRVETYAAPYSYVYSSEEDQYKLGFNTENNFTQISRWITFKDSTGKYVERPEFTVEPGASLEVFYRITTPNNIPAGGQYAVIFAHTLTSSISASGIRTEASPGLIVYGRSTEGEAVISAEISNLEIGRGVTDDNNTRNNIYAKAKVKNVGNVDFNAVGTLKAEPIIGFSSYETPANRGKASIIPEAELVVSDEWEETPGFGIYKVTWTENAGESEEVTEKIIFLVSPVVIIITIILLTILIVWIIILVRKRKERRSRLAV